MNYITPNAKTTLADDFVVVAVFAAMTTAIRTMARHYFERTMPDWQKLQEDIKSRLAVEVAVIPSRIVLFYLTLPTMLKGFEPIENWTANDTKTSLLSCSILTGAYIIDLTVTRNDKGSTLHHCMGPALLLWIRTCFSTFTSADALLSRLLMQFIFFGATISGATTTTLVFLYQFRKTWFKSAELSNAYFYFTLLLPVLTMSTIASTFWCTSYLHHWFDELFAYFGHWGYLPLGWVLLECGMQWKWLLWFFNFEVWYRTGTLADKDVPAESRAKLEQTHARAWWLPAWRFWGINALIAAWGAMVMLVIWRSGDIQALGTKINSWYLRAHDPGMGSFMNKSGIQIEEHSDL